METTRLILVFLHTLIIIFAAVDLYHHFPSINKAANHQQRFSAIFCYIMDLFRISFYHTISILAVWFSRQHGAGVVRASGILLIGEFLHMIASVLRQMFETKHLPDSELYFIAVFYLLLLTAVLITFRLVEKISARQQSSTQV